METLQADLDRAGSALFGVAIDGLRTVKRHRRADQWYYPIWHRKDGHIDWVSKAFIDRAGLGLPLFLVVSRSGQILYWHNKPLNRQVMAELVTAASAARGRPSMR